jgi:hypothetical protein
MNEEKTNEIRAGVLQGAGVALVVLALAAPVVWWTRAAAPKPPAASPSATAPAALPHSADFGDADAPPDVRTVAGWAVASRDHGPSSFAVIDKRRTHLYVFDAQGHLRGDTPVLLGYAPGDDSVPGIGQRPIAEVRPQERTTPAGRFEAGSGRNLLNEDVIWVDYRAAVSMHRVRATDPRERRLERLATPTTDDNRISYGCINVPVAFFDTVVWPQLGGHQAVVYVLPEVKTFDQVFPQAAAWGASSP